MLRKLGVAGLVAGAAFGVALTGSPAFASGWHGGDEEFTQVVEVETNQECGLDGAEGPIAVNIPVLAEQEAGGCSSSIGDE